MLSNTFYFVSYSIINADTVWKVIYREKCLYSSWTISIRHIGYLCSTRNYRYFGSRVPYSVNSTSVFNVVRLLFVISVDINPNPGPRISSSITIHSRSHPNKFQNLSNLVRINCDADQHPRPLNRSLTVCLVNARSMQNKSAMFFNYLYDCKAENWLSFNDSAVCKEITPSGFK